MLLSSQFVLDCAQLRTRIQSLTVSTGTPMIFTIAAPSPRSSDASKLNFAIFLSNVMTTFFCWLLSFNTLQNMLFCLYINKCIVCFSARFIKLRSKLSTCTLHAGTSSSSGKKAIWLFNILDVYLISNTWEIWVVLEMQKHSPLYILTHLVQISNNSIRPGTFNTPVSAQNV